jgi:predicted O-linked N-acetylglucosamine transferase (SPINDLY family)
MAAAQTASLHDWERLAETMEGLYQEMLTEGRKQN